MNQQPDKLFREKLEGLHKPAPVNAWSRVEAGLDKKNNRVLWLKVAASLLLLAVAAILLWPQDKAAHQPLATQKNAEKKEQPVNKTDNPVPPKETISLEKKPVSPSTSSIAAKTLTKKQKNKKADLKENTVVIDNVLTPEVHEEKIAVVEETISPVSENPVTEATIAKTTPEEDHGVTLVFTAEEVNEKYLDKKALAEATSAEKKTSTLRKLLDKAYDLKHNQDPFGDLRQKKNEILALNFKNEKQRSQNK